MLEGLLKLLLTLVGEERGRLGGVGRGRDLGWWI